jgi:hypothetical protein
MQEIARLRGAAEHVGEDGDTVATVDAIYRPNDITATVRGRPRSNGDGFNLFLRTYDMFERRLNSSAAPMGHKHRPIINRVKRCRAALPLAPMRTMVFSGR